MTNDKSTPIPHLSETHHSGSGRHFEMPISTPNSRRICRSSVTPDFRTPSSETSTPRPKELFPVISTSTSSCQTDHYDNLISKMTAARKNGRLTDVNFTFLGSPQSIQAHKLVLALGSPVFETMFYGSQWKDIMNENIEISEITPSVFEMLIEFFYSGKLHQNHVTVDATIDLLYAASKYCVNSLATILISSLTESITLDNVLLILETAMLFNADDLKAKCWICIECDTDRILLTDKFLNLEKDVLKEIVKHEPLTVSEIGLYNAVIKLVEMCMYAQCQKLHLNKYDLCVSSFFRWAIVNCSEIEITNGVPSPTNIRNAIGEEIFHLIRFPTMDPKDFCDGPALSGMFSQPEINNILLNKFSTNQIEPQLFSRIARHRNVLELHCPCNRNKQACSFCADVITTTEEEKSKKEVNMFITPRCYCKCRMKKYCPSRIIR